MWWSVKYTYSTVPNSNVPKKAIQNSQAIHHWRVIGFGLIQSLQNRITTSANFRTGACR